jgi:hypothetical protein
MDTQISENAAAETRRERRAPQGRVLLDGYLLESELCRELNIVSRTARKWRQTGEGPPWANVGAMIVYPIDGFHKWLAKRVRNTRRGA